MTPEPPKGATVTPATSPRPGQLRLLGEVAGHATDPFTGQRLVRVQWPNQTRPAFHLLTEVIEVPQI